MPTVVLGDGRSLYGNVHVDGVFLVDEGLRVSRPSPVIDGLVDLGVRREGIYCDRFALGSRKDAAARRWLIVDRGMRWSEATEDIAGFRCLMAKGPMSVAEECRACARAGLSQAVVHSDDQESVDLAKRRHGRSRGDVGAGAVRSRGARARVLPGRPGFRLRYPERGSLSANITETPAPLGITVGRWR